MSNKINILRGIVAKKTGGFVIEKKPNDCVAYITNGNKIRFVNQNESSNVFSAEVPNDNYIIEPYLPMEQQRSITVVSGESGSGKTLLSSLLIKQYATHKPKNKIYFVSQAPYQNDPNLRDLPLIQLNNDTIDENEILNLGKSLMVFDDNDFSENLKKIMKILNQAVEIGRKLEISIIFITHINSRLNMSPIYREFDMYITFVNNLTNNRMLEQNMKMDPMIIEDLKKKKPAYICFNKKYSSVITDSEIFKY